MLAQTPDFYRAERVGTLYVPDVAAAVQAGQALGLPPAEKDARRVLLLLVDPQVDFVHTDGALSVPGAVEDTRRTIAWIFAHVGALTRIAVSLDSHIPTQIFFPTWWLGPQGEHPAPFTPITAAEVEAGRWKPLFEPQWSRHYVRELEARAKKTLMIWPYHTLMGTPGHSITPALYEAIIYHAAARAAQPILLPKGTLPKTEHYSLLEPEVKVPGEPQGELNRAFVDELTHYERIYVAGQAKSHCVLETLGTVMRVFADRPQEIAKWHVLTDCMSSVAHPEIDFEAQAEETLARYAERGLKLTTSREAM